MKTTYFQSIATPSVSKLTNSFFVTLAAFALAAISLLTLGAAPASASIIVTSGPSNTGTDNVLFTNNPPDGLTVQGITNSGTITVDLTGVETLHADGGQALVRSVDGSFTQLAVSIAGHTFTKLVWNLDTLQGAGTGNVEFFANSSSLGTFSLGNGSNFYTIEATGGDAFTSISFLSSLQLQDTAQIRIGGVSAAGPGTDPDVPEPGTLVTMGLALVGVSLVRRHRS